MPPIGRDVAVFYSIVLVLALWSSFGPAAGLYTLLYHTVPVFSLLRAPARFGLAVTLALTVFSAAGLTVLARRGSERDGADLGRGGGADLRGRGVVDRDSV